MSRENLEVVRSVYEQWARGDFSDNSAFDPDVEFELVDWPHTGRSRGVDAMWATWSTALAAWDDFRSEPSRYIDVDDRLVVVLNRISGRGKVSGAEVVADTATVWTLDRGKVTRLALYWDTATALEAAGAPR
jgi:ketosteroid isomerase-like protein